MKLIFEDSNNNGIFRLRKEDASLKGDGMLKAGTPSTIVFNRIGEQKVIIDKKRRQPQSLMGLAARS